MKRLLLTAALLLTTLVGGLCAQEVFDRPETSANWFLTAIYSNPMTAADVELYQLLRQDAGLKKLVEVANFHEYHDGMDIIRTTRWKTYLGVERPALLLQGAARTEGMDTVADNVFFAKGGVIHDSERVLDSLHEAIRRYGIYMALPREARTQRWRPFKQGCPGGVCPRRPGQPGGPGPEPLVEPTTPPEVVVPILPITPFDINVLLGPEELEVVVEVPPADIEPYEGGLAGEPPAAPAAEEEGIPLIALLFVAAAGFAGYVSSQKS